MGSMKDAIEVYFVAGLKGGPTETERAIKLVESMDHLGAHWTVS